MKKYLFYIIIAVCIGFVIFLAQDSDEFSWLRAKLGDKSTDYMQYIKANPDGWHVFEAQKRFDKRSWKEAAQGGTLAHFQNYLKHNPEGLYVNSANENILYLKWMQVNQTNSIEEYERFMEQYPESQYVLQAKKSIEEINWRKVSSGRNIDEFIKFIAAYPDGEYAALAENMLEDLIWDEAHIQKDKQKILEYMRIYPSGRYIANARNLLSEQPEPWPVYIEYYHLYDLTNFDKDYGYIFENQIGNLISKMKEIKVVPEKSDAVVHLQIGYALSFREGQSGEDNISKFIENRWRDRAVIKQKQSLPTYDLCLHLYLWDIKNDCLLAYSSSVTPPEPGNAAPAVNVGRDKFLDDHVKKHLENSFIQFLKNLQKGKDDVMYLTGENPAIFYRHDIGTPKRRVYVNFENGPISIYQWRDPSIERYILFHLQQSDMDCVRQFDNQGYKLLVKWSKYERQMQMGSPVREYGLSADFIIYEKGKEGKDRAVFNKTITSDKHLEIYGLQPIDVINQWRKVFDNSYIVGEIVKAMKKTPMNARQE
ncbi:MAG: hypothetical protein JW787_11140 [Sedimentisphaerales bacterium]|nr:hypothetical protein [Sedimentisphaerales bacterium]